MAEFNLGMSACTYAKCMEEPDPLEHCWNDIKAKIKCIKFNAEAHGFLVLIPPENEADKCFAIEDRGFNKKFSGCVEYLKPQDRNLFVIYDFNYVKIGGGNSRGLLLINWHPKGPNKIAVTQITQQLAIFSVLDATCLADLDNHKVVEAAAKGNCAYGADWFV